jgi:hypothetical protein
MNDEQERADWEQYLSERQAIDYAAYVRREQERERELQEGMPGTWSHCGNAIHHKAHRHTVVMNEGPYHNILCKGTPGNVNADAPLGRIVYEEG